MLKGGILFNRVCHSTAGVEGKEIIKCPVAYLGMRTGILRGGGGGHEGMMVVPDVCRGALCSNAVFLLDF